MYLVTRVDPRILRKQEMKIEQGAVGSITLLDDGFIVPKEKDNEEIWLIHAAHMAHNDAAGPHVCKLFIFFPERNNSAGLESVLSMGANELLCLKRPLLLLPGMQLGASVDAIGAGAQVSLTALFTRIYMPKGAPPANPLELFGGIS